MRQFCMILLLSLLSLALSAQQTSYDRIAVDRHEIYVDLTDLAGGTLRGRADLLVRSRAAKTSVVTLNLLGMEVDSVLVGGKLLDGNSVSYNGSVLDIRLERPLKAAAAPVPVTIVYHGKTVSRRFGGFSWYPEQGMAHNMGVSINDIPHSFSKSWYPAVDDFRAKSTYVMTYRVPVGLTAVGNGVLRRYDVLPDGSCEWTWEICQPVPDYLVNVAVGDYRLVHYNYDSISSGGVPIDIYVTPDEYWEAEKAYSIIPAVLRSLENRFGAYAFDRVGFVSVNTTGGAMEHATNISMPRRPLPTDGYRELAIHELIHSWFGNFVTCETPGDMWLNEGITSYVVEVVLEDLVAQGISSQTALDGYRKGVDKAAMSIPKDSPRYHPLAGTPEDDTYGTLVYKKGAWVTRQLRTLLGDEAFFRAMKQYVSEYAFGNATTEEFKSSVEKSTGVDLTAFFKEHIYN